MATARTAVVHDWESEYRGIERWYRDELAKTPPPTGLQWQPISVGPTWKHDGNGWLLPQVTLGWRFLAWCGIWLRDREGREWQFTMEQARFWLWYYALDESGRWLYASAVLQRLKGWGKDPMLAACSAATCFGPTMFDRWDGDTPIGTEDPAAWVQLIAVSQQQTQNTMKLFPSLFKPEAIKRFGIQVGRLNVWGLGDTVQIEAITSNYLSVEGGRPTLVGRNEALALDTTLPTPNGWTTVADVAEGDILYGSRGPVTVTHVTPVYRGRPCFKVTFADGASVVADDGHLWSAYRVGHPRVFKTRTTGEMHRLGGRFAVPLPTCEGDDRDVDLPVDPYVLGYWLGDGSSDAPNLAVGPADIDWFLAEMRGRGYLTTVTAGVTSSAARVGLRIPGCARNRNDPKPPGLYARLKSLGVIRNKHIPDVYMRASRNQRLELLRGLMDSDGWCTKSGMAGFSVKLRGLIESVAELAASLGYVPGEIVTRTDDRWSKPVEMYRIQFRADVNANPFRLPRKRDRVTLRTRAAKTITSIEPVESVPVKCIEVDAEDHLFCFGERWTLTHNTQNWNSSNQGHEMAGAVEGNIAKAERGRARILDVCNAYRPGEDSVGQRAREAWETANANSINIGVLYDSLEAPPNAPLTLEAAPDVVRSIAGDSYWLDTEPDGRIVKSIANLSNPPSESRRKWYNQITATADAWVSPQTFDAQGVDDEPADGERVVLFFDGSKSDDSTALVGCRLSDGFVFTVDVWEKPPHTKTWLVDREDVDRVVSEAHDYWDVRAMWADPSGDARDDDTGERYWDNLIDSWGRRWGEGYDLPAVKTGDNAHPVKWEMRTPSHQKLFVEHAERYVTDVAETNLPHDTDRRLAQHHANARRVPSKFGISLAKEHRESRRKIDAAVCAVGARMMWRIYQATVTTKERTGQAVFFSM